MEPDAVRDTVARVAIDALQRAYADAVNRRAWDDLEALFLPDAIVELDLGDRPGRTLEGPAELSGFIRTALERFAFFQFAILNSHVTLWPEDRADTAAARLTITELRIPVASPDGARDDSFGVYHDHYRLTGDGWRIADRHYRSLSRGPR